MLQRTGVTLQRLWIEDRDAALARGNVVRPYQYRQPAICTGMAAEDAAGDAVEHPAG